MVQRHLGVIATKEADVLKIDTSLPFVLENYFYLLTPRGGISYLN